VNKFGNTMSNVIKKVERVKRQPITKQKKQTKDKHLLGEK